MPSCLVNQCISKTGRKGQNGQIILHHFPKDITRIKLWLQQTGQAFKDINALAQRIFDEKKYCLCSCHFTLDSYIINVQGRTLRVDAIPSIFPVVNEDECIIQENLKKDRRRTRKRPFDLATNSFQHPLGLPRTTPIVERIIVNEEMFQDTSSDGLQPPTIDPPTTPVIEKVIVKQEMFPDTDNDSLPQPAIQPPMIPPMLQPVMQPIIPPVIQPIIPPMIQPIAQPIIQTPIILLNGRIKVEDKTFEDPQSTTNGFCSIATQTDHTLSNSLVVYKEEREVGSDVQDGRLTPDVPDITVKEEPEYYSDTDVSARYWKVESAWS
ncbi:uncharacterized protein RB166_009291 [Leptodactylus fuscus]|uniref:uncharacterized protein LOC142202577 n=1 Tax=Leptodactylus fuscus TaxID=238119 RepID=UPI003F4E5F87